MTAWPPSPGAIAPEHADALSACFPSTPFELRWSLYGSAAGTAAVRVLAPRGPVAPRHAEPGTAAAPFTRAARCGTAAAWLLAAAPPAGPVDDVLAAVAARHTAHVLQRLAAERAALTADLLESLTHRLRTDITTLQAVAEGMLLGVVGGAERDEVAQEVKAVGREAQRRLSAAREAMSALDPAAPRTPEPIADTLLAELDGLGIAARIEAPGEAARAALPAPGWGACARLLAPALAGTIRIVPDPLGWAVETGDPAAAQPWRERALGPLATAGQIAAAGGGSAAAATTGDGETVVRLTVPAAPSAGS